MSGKNDPLADVRALLNIDSAPDSGLNGVFTTIDKNLLQEKHFLGPAHMRAVADALDTESSRRQLVLSELLGAEFIP